MQAEKAETDISAWLRAVVAWERSAPGIPALLSTSNQLLLELEFARICMYLYRALLGAHSRKFREVITFTTSTFAYLRIPSHTFAFLRRPRSSGWRKGKGNENRPFEIDPSCWKSCHFPCGMAWYGLMHPDSILSLKTYHRSRKSGGNLAGIQHRKPAFNGQKNHATLPLPHRTLKVHLVLRHNAQSAWPLNPCTLPACTGLLGG